MKPSAKLIWTVEAESHFEAMTAYYKFQGWEYIQLTKNGICSHIQKDGVWINGLCHKRPFLKQIK
jgi:hypothetical protein